MKAAVVKVLAAMSAAAIVAGAQQRPPVRPLGPTVAKSTEQVTMVMGVRALPGGRMLVNDPMRRRVLLMDSTLATVSVVADSTPATANAYSGRMGGLIPYRGDSTLFVDPQSMSMLVIDPAGKVGRVMSVPRSQDAMSLAGPAMGVPGFDASGRLIYRSSNRFMMRGPMAAAGGSGGAARTPGAFSMPDQPDSAAIVRIDLSTRELDTLAFIRIPKVKMRTSQDSAGRIQMTSEINPLPVVDEWAMLPDGSLAIVRGRDYHVDLIGADGKTTSAAKIPFDWQRLSDDDKIALIDSVKAVRERMAAAAAASHAAGGGTATAAAAATGGMGTGGQERVMITMGGPGAPAGGARGGATTTPQLLFVPPSELPDYKPPFFAGSVRADTEGNLWILTIPTKALAGGPVYDVVNRKGELVDRVQVPVGRQIIGFGSAGDVILIAREQGSAWLERAKVR